MLKGSARHHLLSSRFGLLGDCYLLPFVLVEVLMSLYCVLTHVTKAVDWDSASAWQSQNLLPGTCCPVKTAMFPEMFVLASAAGHSIATDHCGYNYLCLGCV